MYDTGKVIAGLVIFVGLFTFAFWYDAGKAAPRPEPKLDTPEIQKMAKKECIESKQFMVTTHMQFLNHLRDQALRDGNRWYVNAKGEKIWISLQNTCLKCHSNKKDFCDKCHNYAGVEPYCWDCHIDPNRSEL